MGTRQHVDAERPVHQGRQLQARGLAVFTAVLSGPVVSGAVGQLPLAFTNYQRALQLDPRHRGAHEYIGEAYLMANNLTKAEEHLAALQRICLIPCEEYDDLKKAIVEYRAHVAK
jgi:tetratricopeptide (TPR) repeat protein